MCRVRPEGPQRVGRFFERKSVRDEAAERSLVLGNQAKAVGDQAHAVATTEDVEFFERDGSMRESDILIGDSDDDDRPA